MIKRILVILTLLAGISLWGAATTVPLIAGQEYEAGEVFALAENGFLTVEIQADNGWVLDETHVYVGTTPPRKSAPGRFPYQHEALGGTENDVYEIPLDEYGVSCGATLYIAVHAVVVGASNEHGEETAWGEGDEIRAGKNWAMFFETLVLCGPLPR